jgi:hypothetical protein
MRLVIFWSSVEWIFWLSSLELCGSIGFCPIDQRGILCVNQAGRPTCVGLSSCVLGALHMVPFCVEVVECCGMLQF